MRYKKNPPKAYYTKKNGVYSWIKGDNLVKIEFSKPSIQAHHDYDTIDDINGAMYFYYDICLYVKQYVYDDDGETRKEYWKQVARRNTFDFPSITQFEHLLNYMLNKEDPTKNGQKVEYHSGKIEYKTTYTSEEFLFEDYYEITKIVNENGENDRYNMYVGCSFEPQGGYDTNGIKLLYLYRQEIVVLQKCVKEFLNYAVEKYNKSTLKLIENRKDQYFVQDGKIYEYDKDSHNNYTITKNFESIYIVGDIVSIDILTKDNGVVELYKQTISKIENNNITLSNGETYGVGDIVYIADDIPNEKLSYNLDQVYDDFRRILTNYDIDFFKNNSEKDIYKKYKGAIASRTWMYREEHNFPTIINKEIDHHDNVNKHIRLLVSRLKKEICQTSKTCV